MKKTFAEQVIGFNKKLVLNIPLPPNIIIMNPFQNNKGAMQYMQSFYKKFYSDIEKRFFIIGINPGRFGAAVTGVPFTDTKRLAGACAIPYSGKETHEPSSVFIYDMIEAFGGAQLFYQYFYINSVVPLGFAKQIGKDKFVNYNYYDDKGLQTALKPFILQSLQQQFRFGMYTHAAFCLGSGKNFNYIQQLNDELHFFEKIIPLEHPRFIMQYRQKTKQHFMEKYIQAFQEVISQ
ncbi:uracil-DNA glycosylase family protein [Hydrotalea sp.]|uniref:uracil-DNA glycosylase family protein n=1 Tax=Hydrotalea sp. TaxID=2881279 RepID=UPI00262B7127|nr:uracil-DNA glycosylase family protein [Hydrotalea sp.]